MILPPDVHVQAPPNLADDFGVLLDAGIDDWGGVSPVTADYVNPERPWPALDRLREVTEAARLRARAPAHRLPRVRARPRALARPGAALPGAGPQRRRGPRPRRPRRGLPAAGRPRSRTSATAPRSCSSGRRSTAWYSGAEVEPAVLRPAARPAAGRRRGGRGARRRARRRGGRRGRDRHAVLGPGPRGRGRGRGGRRAAGRTNGDVVTFVRNRNINYTNVCTFKCRFCGFSKGPLSLNLRGRPTC